jgi:uncharacterized membrane protein
MTLLAERESSAPVSGVRPSPLSTQLPPERRITVERRAAFAAMGVLVAATNALLAFGVYIPWASPLAGFVCCVGIPTFLLYMSGVYPGRARSERLGISVLLSLLLLMATGLLANTVLPHLGVAGALGAVPVVVIVDALCVALAAWAFRRHPPTYVVTLPRLSPRDWTVLCLAALAVPMAALGAVRLNNGAGGGLTLCMLVVLLCALGLLVAWREQLHGGVVPAVIYCASLALLFMTSLRGWYVTGHDAQLEYRVFELAKTHGNWHVSRFQDAYNGCLSITILPTMIWHWTRVADPYVYKVFYQVLFALCPVLVYRLARRVSSATVALLGTIYFISFVTFFQDMPMLNRQEIAFLFLAGALLVMFNDRLSVQSRRAWLVVLAVGMIWSHYSTTYVAIGVFILAWLARAGIQRIKKAPRPRGHVLGPVTIGLVVVASLLWTVPITHTETGLWQTVSAAANSLRGGPGHKSSDTSYGLFLGHQPSPAQRLAEYKQASLQATAAARKSGAYYDTASSPQYAATAASQPQLPLTSLGSALSRIGLNVSGFNSAVRQASARVLQLLIGLGLLAFLFARRKRIHANLEFYCLAAANLVVVLVQVVLPVLSVDYGVLRSFQQSLMILDVFLVVGSLALIPRIAERRRILFASVLALGFFASSTGMITQVLGGYDPQLHLNNSGTYYDTYYVHPEELAGMTWLSTNSTAGTDGTVQAEVETYRYTFTDSGSLVRIDTLDDIYPELIRQDAYVFLGYTNVRERLATVSIDGDLVTYHYPLNFLDDNKDLIYANGGARVYR